jgi:hypothetical protein
VGIELDEDEAAEQEHMQRAPAYAPVRGLFGARREAAPSPAIPPSVGAGMGSGAAAAAESGVLDEPTEGQREVLRGRLGWRMAYVDPAVERKAALMVDEATGRMTAEGEAYLKVIAGLWLPEEQARYFAASAGRAWESLPETNRRQLRDSFDAMNVVQRFSGDALAKWRADLVGMPAAPTMASEPSAVAGAFAALPPMQTARTEALDWFRRLQPGYARAMLGEAVYEAMRQQPPPEFAMAEVERHYARMLDKLRAWWSGLPASVRLDYRRVFGASAASEMQLIKLAYQDREVLQRR